MTMYTAVYKIVCDNVCYSIQNRMQQCILQYTKSYATMYIAVYKIICNNVYCSIQNRMRQCIQNHMPQVSDLCILQYPKLYTAMDTAVCKFCNEVSSETYTIL